MPLSLATSKERRKRKERERLRKLELTRVRSRAKVAGRGRGRPRKTDVERAEKAALAAIAKRALAEERRRAALPTGGGDAEWQSRYERAYETARSHRSPQTLKALAVVYDEYPTATYSKKDRDCWWLRSWHATGSGVPRRQRHSSRPRRARRWRADDVCSPACTLGRMRHRCAREARGAFTTGWTNLLACSARASRAEGRVAACSALLGTRRQGRFSAASSFVAGTHGRRRRECGARAPLPRGRAVASRAGTCIRVRGR